MNKKKLHGSTNKTSNSQSQPPATSDQRPGTRNQKPATRSRPFIIPVFIPHAGCPHQCVFCNQVSITGAKTKRVPPAELQTQINEFLQYKKKNRKPVQIAFFGGNFLGLKSEEIKSLLNSAAEFVRNGQVDSIRFSTRPDTINERCLDIIRHYPVSTVELGVQSMDDHVLTLAGRGHSASDTVRAVEQLKERHFNIGLQMMVGLPGDDEIRSLTTARRIADLQPDFVRIYPTVVVANSRLAGWYKSGDYVPLSLEEGVTLVKKIYLKFIKRGIDVIRMGLQTSEDLEDGTTVLAGPHHPAFGHLVYSEVFYDAAHEAIRSLHRLNGCITIAVNPKNVSKMRGLRNANIKAIKSGFNLKVIKIIPDPSLTEDELAVWHNTSVKVLNIVSYS